ncbi:MAG: Lrp/AsnC ligand binding domain-containing protein [Vulcanimicrobiota bacterium]
MSTVLLYGYIFLKLREGSDFYGTFRELYSDRNVIYCDAVRGAFDVILLAQGRTADELDAFVKRCVEKQGVQNTEFSPVENFKLSGRQTDAVSETDSFPAGKGRAGAEHSGNNVCSSYAMVEVEGEEFEQVYRSICNLDSVTSCDVLKDKHAILLTVKAPLFERIDELVSKKIARLDGVLRVSQYLIMGILEMQAG